MAGVCGLNNSYSSYLLKGISCDTLIICGEKDTVNNKVSSNLSRNIPNAKFYLVQGSGHEVNTDTPEKLAQILEKFYFTSTYLN